MLKDDKRNMEMTYMKKSELKMIVKATLKEATASSPQGRLEKAIADSQALIQKYEKSLDSVDDAISAYTPGMEDKVRSQLAGILNELDGAHESAMDALRKLKKLIAANEKAGM